MTPPPLPRTADCGVIDAFSPDFSAFVFKIQANMNKAHRDRLAFMRICSGKFEREAEVLPRAGRQESCACRSRSSSWRRSVRSSTRPTPGDIIGVFDPGIFSIGDTITTPGKKFRFARHPDVRRRSISPASARRTP